jgi:RND family efflux transporter MFP subunit
MLDTSMTNKSELLGRLKIDKDFQPQHSGKPKILVIAGLIVLLLIIVLWLLFSGEREFTVKTAMARVEARGAGGGSVILQATGYVTARRQATVSSKTTGQVAEVLVEEGDRVEAGQVVARLDNSNALREDALAQSQLAAARARENETAALLKEAELTVQRRRELWERKLISRAEVDNAEAAQQSLQAQLRTRQADIKTAEQHVHIQRQLLDDLVIRAPFNGVVVAKNAQPGEIISPMSAGGGFTRTGICSLVDMESLEIEVDANEAYIYRILPGQAVQAALDAYPDWTIPAKVAAIVPTADRQKATVKVRIAFEQLDSRILPDMGIKVSFMSSAAATDSAPAAIRVPASAVRHNHGAALMYVVEDGKARERAVSVQADGEMALIASGLEPGETYIVELPDELYDGATVVTE